MNRHFVKNIILVISWAVLTFITDSLIINYFCFDATSANTANLSDFYELELCVQSKEIIISSIYIYTALLAMIGIYQLAQSIYKNKSSDNNTEDSKQLRVAAQALIIISVSLASIIQTSFVI
jgi:putative exporter of polyketide antibiotics